MAQLVIPEAVLVRLVWQKSGSDWASNVLAARVGAGTNVTQALTNTIDSAFKAHASLTNWLTALPTIMGLGAVCLRDIRTANQAEFRGAGAAVAGAAAGVDPLPPNVALCITLRTALAGRSFRGRAYLAGISETANDSTGHCVAGTQTAAVSMLTALQSVLSANGLTLAVASRPQDAHVGLDGIEIPARAGFITNVTSIQARNGVWDSQRRRTKRWG